MPLSFLCNRLHCHAHPRFVSVVEQRTCALLIPTDFGMPPSAVTSIRRCRQPRPRVVTRLAPRHPAGTLVASPSRSKPRLAAPTPTSVKSAPIRGPIQPHGRGPVSPGRPLSRPSGRGASSLPTGAPDQLRPRLATPEIPWSGRLHRSVPQRPLEQSLNRGLGQVAALGIEIDTLSLSTNMPSPADELRARPATPADEIARRPRTTCC
jgi:hypothetical protein